ncbi:hypothetical protein [Thermostaphylospora chromogena]|uniref:SPW repeat-containing protein n=1 Tax=Thermostaphylospora chromogena TaxID=35622 RepID=A0A1H1BIK9_9ACTN|nr:hypothetical protein [Thermostaphylospora chromogena]SDQ51792.1 hypothetical protein SAMN04489764_0985 [Thermostaphylospora chromogena]
MNVLSVARGVAAVMTVIMVVYLALDGAHRPANPFLVPDIAVAVLLAGAALLPRRAAPVGLVFAFAWTAGVITVSLFSYVVRGEFSWGNLALVLAALVTAASLAGDTVRDGEREPVR